MYLYKKTALFCAAALSLMTFAGCSSDSKTDSSSKSDSSESSSDVKAEIYLDSDGSPYYYDSEGNKMILYSYSASDDDSEYDETDYYVYDHYESDGLVFDIPDGWFADTTYGAPMLFMDSEDGDINYDESISFVSTETVLDSDVTDVKQETIESYLDELISYGYYNSYEITDSGSLEIAGKDANYFDMTVSYSLDEDEVSFRSRYIFTTGEGSYCVSITSLDDDDSFNKMLDVYTEVEQTLTLPDAEQTEEADEEAADDDSVSEEETEE